MIVAKNEEKTIGDIIDGCSGYGHIIVINDNSVDSTFSIIKKKNIFCITNSESIGYGSSILKGIDEACTKNYTHLITIDADGEHDPQCIKKFIEKLKNRNDMVFGIRKEHYRFSEGLFILYYNLKYGVSDILCGMRGFNLKIIEKKHLFLKDELALKFIFNYLNKERKFTEFKISGKKRLNKSRFGNIIIANFKILIYLIKNL